MNSNAITTQLLRPDKMLVPFVKSIAIIESRSAGYGLRSLPFFADGCPGLMYQQSDSPMLLNRSEKMVSLMLYGQTVKPIEMSVEGKFRIIIFYLYPHVLKTIFKIPSLQLTDTCLDFSELSGRGFLNELQQATQSRVQASILAAYLSQLIKTSRNEPDPILGFAVNHILRSKGKTSLSNLRQHLHITERTFERRFEQHVGVTPKLFARIAQFQGALSQLRKQQYAKLSDIAYEAGYADQAHFIRAFRDFTGVSPLEFKKTISMVEEISTTHDQ